MFENFRRNKKRDNDTQDFTNPHEELGIDRDEFAEESEVRNVAETGSSQAAKKGFFVLVCLGVIAMLGFIGIKSVMQKQEAKDVQAATDLMSSNNKLEAPEFKLPEEPPPASAPLPPIEPVPMQPLPAADPAPVEAEPAESKPTPHEIRLRSPLMVSDNDKGNTGGTGGGEAVTAAAAAPAAPADNGEGGNFDENGEGDQSATLNNGMLTGLVTPGVKANAFANRNLLLAKGTVIQCSLRTRIETQVAGMVACVTTRDVYSDNAKVLLLERGSVIEGEYQNAANMGMTRIFVLWTRIRTPKGVVVNLDSPATDALGGAGLGGHTSHHFWRRFGNAVLFSLIQDGIATGWQRIRDRQQNAQNIVNSNTEKSSDQILQEILKSTSNIPPTIYKNHGDTAAVYVARDIDFSSVYSLRPIGRPSTLMY